MTKTLRSACRRTVAIGIVALSVVLVPSGAGAAPKGPKPPPSPGDTIPPTPPTDLRVTATTQTSVSLAWSPSTDNSGAFSYVVKQENLSWTVGQTQTSTTLTWLSPGRTYSFYLYAVDKASNRSGNSDTVVATTQADVTPPSAPALSVPAVSASQIWLTWTEAVDDLPFAGVGYSVYVNGAPATSVNWINHREASLRHLSPGSTYAVQVRARDASGNSSSSNLVSVATPASTDTSPPSAPADLRIDVDQGCAEVWLAWTQSTDDVDPQSAVEYEVYVNGALSPLAVDTGVGRSFAYGTNHGANTFLVKAVDRTGNTSPASNPVTAELWPC